MTDIKHTIVGEYARVEMRQEQRQIKDVGNQTWYMGLRKESQVQLNVQSLAWFNMVQKI